MVEVIELGLTSLGEHVEAGLNLVVELANREALNLSLCTPSRRASSKVGGLRTFGESQTLPPKSLFLEHRTLAL